MAYAAVISLRHTIEGLINPTIDPRITKSAYEELEFVEHVLQRLDRSNSSTNRSVIMELDAEIRNAVWKLEDLLQYYVLSLSLPRLDSLGEEGVKQEVDSFMEKVKMLVEKYNEELDNPMTAGDEDDDVSTIDDFAGNKSTVVGFSDQCEEIRNQLLDSDSRCKIVSIVGMAGIGKTVLAREIYQQEICEGHFDLTAWVSVGPTLKIEEVLVDVLSQIEHMPPAFYADQDKHTLADCLYKCLYSRKYFVVLDDLWNTKEWGYLMNFFPGNNNGSRLLLATRLQKLPCPPDTRYVVHNMRHLSNEESWDLLYQNVFGERHSCPPQLEKSGRKIAENCEGLPLLILAVANSLCGLEKTEEYWNKVANKRSIIFLNAYDNISKVLSSSYEYLPQDLKACFLYMGVFPQNCEIPLTKLINLWTVEDFLEPSQTSEDFAMKCLKELVYRSLVIVEHSSTYGIKSCKLHSAYWSLCNKEAKKNQFLNVFNKLTDVSIQSYRRLSVQNNILLGLKEVYDSIATASTTRSLLFTGHYQQYQVPVCFDLMFLKVLDALAIRFYEFPNEVQEMLHLKYLALTHNGNLPSFISKLQNLQTLIIGQHHSIKLLGDSACLPKDIWNMQELRHLRVMGNNLPDPSDGAELTNLLTLHVKGHSCTENVFRSIPKLKKLGIKIELQPRSKEILRCFEHISILHKIESLKCVVVNPRRRSQVVAPPNPSSSFPRGLKKLSLNGLGYSWEYMATIGSLPNLQVLKIRCLAFRGPKWNTEARQFQSLQFLLLEDIDLVLWETDDENCFPRLQRLIFRHCYNIEEIPRQIEGIPTLETIEIVDCNPSVVVLAQKILEGKRSCGNDSFQVAITSSLNLP